MREVTIQVCKHDHDGVLTLRWLGRHLFPGELVEVSGAETCALVLTGERADYVMDLLRTATDDPAFENFGGWKARNEDQGELSLNDYAEDAPIRATAG
jgi:hypothetical protein